LRYAVFITSGIGNAIFLIPLIKELQKTGTVTLISSSPFGSEQIFKDIPHAELGVIRKATSFVDYIGLSGFVFRKFDKVFIDYFGASRRNLMLGHLIGRETVTAHIPRNLHAFFKTKISLVTPIPGLHEGAQMLRFLDTKMNDSDVDAGSFQLNSSGHKKLEQKRYITIQPGAGNDKTPWKIWPIGEWITLVKEIQSSFPDLIIKVLGDKSDLAHAGYFTQLGPNVKVLIDKTGLHELPKLLSGSALHIGSDSGLLHVAGAMNTRTVTICGGSDPELFGWQKLDAKRHLIIEHKLNCHPCYRYYLPNRSRVEAAKDCPDFKCIRGILPSEILPLVKVQLLANAE
jgi:ADP-heptose:LPS heptosyltransferase